MKKSKKTKNNHALTQDIKLWFKEKVHKRNFWIATVAFGVAAAGLGISLGFMMQNINKSKHLITDKTQLTSDLNNAKESYNNIAKDSWLSYTTGGVILKNGLEVYHDTTPNKIPWISYMENGDLYWYHADDAIDTAFSIFKNGQSIFSATTKYDGWSFDKDYNLYVLTGNKIYKNKQLYYTPTNGDVIDKNSMKFDKNGNFFFTINNKKLVKNLTITEYEVTGTDHFFGYTISKSGWLVLNSRGEVVQNKNVVYKHNSQITAGYIGGMPDNGTGSWTMVLGKNNADDYDVVRSINNATPTIWSHAGRFYGPYTSRDGQNWFVLTVDGKLYKNGILEYTYTGPHNQDLQFGIDDKSNWFIEVKLDHKIIKNGQEIYSQTDTTATGEWNHLAVSRSGDWYMTTWGGSIIQNGHTVYSNPNIDAQAYISFPVEIK